MKHTSLAAFVAALVLAGPAAAQTAPAVSLVNDHSPGLDLSGMDRNVKPGDDFFSFANGGWIAATEIPPDRSSWGTSAMLVELTTARVADLIKTAASGSAGTQERKIADYFSTYLDEAKI